jgi:hypothetical protein
VCVCMCVCVYVCVCVCLCKKCRSSHRFKVTFHSEHVIEYAIVL